MRMERPYLYERRKMMDEYSTHTPILQAILDNKNIASVFEFGCGLYSTILFAKKCKSVISVEMQSKKWHEKMKNKIPKNVNLLYSPGAYDAIEMFRNMKEDFDLVFVDGHGDSRWKCINEAFLKSDIIVTHDVETASYNWHLVNKPNDWYYYEYDRLNPMTGIYFKDNNLFQILKAVK